MSIPLYGSCALHLRVDTRPAHGQAVVVLDRDIIGNEHLFGPLNLAFPMRLSVLPLQSSSITTARDCNCTIASRQEGSDHDQPQAMRPVHDIQVTLTWVFENAAQGRGIFAP